MTFSSRKYFTEHEAAHIIRDVTEALSFLHSKGIAHRDLKPENVLCVYRDRLTPVKLCDFDLGSGIKIHSGSGGSDTTPLLLTPVNTIWFIKNPNPWTVFEWTWHFMNGALNG